MPYWVWIGKGLYILEKSLKYNGMKHVTPPPQNKRPGKKRKPQLNEALRKNLQRRKAQAGLRKETEEKR